MSDDVTTWTDGYGVWYAAVPLTDRPRHDAHVAREAIRDELRARETPTWDPSIVGVRLDHVKGHGRAVYREHLRY